MGTEVTSGKNSGWEVKGQLVPGDAEDTQSAQGFWGERTQGPCWPAPAVCWGFATVIHSHLGWWQVLGWGTNTIINLLREAGVGRLTPLLPRCFHSEKQPDWLGWDIFIDVLPGVL